MRDRRSLAALAAVALVATTGCAGTSDPPPPSPTAEGTTGPELTTPEAALDAALHCPAALSHPERDPVLLVHGTGVTAAETWEWGMQEGLSAAGLDVCTVDLPSRSLVDIQESTEYVVGAVETMHALSGRKVDLIGHSQGNLQIRWALRWWPEMRAATDDAVLLASPSHGVETAAATCPTDSCNAAGWQMSPGSEFLRVLNDGDETPGTVSYTSIYSATDPLVVPTTTAALEGAQNIELQEVCPLRPVTHAGILYDAVTFDLVLDALSHDGPADPASVSPAQCLATLAPGVSAADVSRLNAEALTKAFGRIATAERVSAEPPLRDYARD
ncbi:esterase/lipase family protein [Nocardioides sp. GXZ039]|uniref:esterase/lipase family protein n=1 Tax=Nocardioides sp. GXZ039 TaxID=3136018 RepID=UPI0030F41063